jgi:ribonuclease HII
MDETKDLLQTRIEKAKSQLTDETLSAINAIDWKSIILRMRDKMGYSLEQLGTLETETELVLCGLLNPRDYPKELENRMGISKIQTNELVNEMNKQVFSKIKEELVKISEKKSEFVKIPAPEETHETEAEKNNNTQILNNAGIEIIPEKLEINGKVQSPTPSILAQKLSTPIQTATVKTDHSLPNITTPSTQNKPARDPYREIPE